ncbi:phage Gp37/Gp68 family protein [Actinoallomurus oryzae]|uniref:Phage Gp37/Gp68 family protein n=1 Tax=Actinoallomurus oryzae TaxID=502180 RepID=A0ABP8R9R9_9ACTN
MSDHSTIEWTDATWNPVTGCTKLSPGCDHCYAETFAERWRGTPGHHFENGFDVTLRPERLDQPLKWKKPRRVFVNSMSDLFHDAVPDAFIVAVFTRMWWSPQHTFQILTKRHGRMRSLMPRIEPRLREMERDLDLLDAPTPLHWPLPNVWLGVSVENQHWADLRIPALLQTPAAVRFISAEPLLGPLDLSRWLRPVPDCGYVDAQDGTCAHPAAHTPECHRWADCPVREAEDAWSGIDWVIAGGESGPGARPMHPDWVRSLRDQCEAIGEPFFFKQWGAWAPDHEDGRQWPEGAASFITASGEHTPGPAHGSRSLPMRRVGKKAAGRRLDGQLHHQFPAVDAQVAATSSKESTSDGDERPR